MKDAELEEDGGMDQQLKKRDINRAILKLHVLEDEYYYLNLHDMSIL